VLPSDRHQVSLEQLQGHTAWLAGKARAEGTSKSYVKLWNGIVLPFCRARQLDPFALSSGHIADILAWHEMGGKAGEVERLFNAIRATYSSRNLSLPDCPLARDIVKGSRRIYAEEKADVERHAFPAHRLADLCSPKSPAMQYANHRTGVRNRALLATGLRTMS
jgi:hypothetical protein